MKKFFMLCFVCLIFGCASYKDEVKPINAVEILGIKGKPLTGKTYSVSCEGNRRTGKDDVWACVLKKASEQAKADGYKYFTILEKDAFVPNMAGSYDKIKLSTTAPVKHKYLKSTKTYTTIILVLEDDELSPWKNIYTVEDYLIKSSK